MTDTPSGIGVRDVDQFRDGVRAIADDVGGDTLGDRDELVVDDKDAVVLAGDVALDDNGSGTAFSLRDQIKLADFGVVLEVDADSPAVVAVERFDDDRVADPLCLPDRFVGVSDHETAGNRDTNLLKQAVRQFLVGSEVDGDVRG